MSEFYKKPENAATYKLLLDFARQRNQSLYTEILQTFGKDYKSTWYLDRPPNFSYTDLAGYYVKWRNKNRKLPKFERALPKKVREEGGKLPDGWKGRRRR